jgi:hypothetical protein
VAFNPEIEKRIRSAVKPGDPWTLDEMTDKICGDDREQRREFGEIVVDEYRRRFSAMPRQEMRELYRRCYKDESDANKG